MYLLCHVRARRGRRRAVLALGDLDTRWRWRTLDEIPPEDVRDWAMLGDDAVVSSPFSMPQFVLPAARWLTPAVAPRVLWIEGRDASGDRLLGVGCFEQRSPSLLVPMPHLRGYHTMHSFRGGIACRRGAAERVADALLAALRSPQRVQALDLRTVPADCEVFQAFERRLHTLQGQWCPQGAFGRPQLRIDDDDVLSRLGTSLNKDLRRRLRRLREQGDVEFRVLRGADAAGEAIDRHLQLEHAGWKGEQGTSMLSTREQTAFFREMASGFAATGNMVFSEICLDGEVIASTSNILVGDTLHAFKCGWHPGHARHSPGRLNEWLLIGSLRENWPALACFDSNSAASSYMASLLPDRRTHRRGVYALSAPALVLQRVARYWRPLAWRFGADD